MGFIEYAEGCPPASGCFGPQGWMVMGTELYHLSNHLHASIILGLILFVSLLFLKEKGKITLSYLLITIIPILVMVVLFFLFAYLFPVIVVY